jgi:hypothetical protein
MLQKQIHSGYCQYVNMVLQRIELFFRINKTDAQTLNNKNILDLTPRKILIKNKVNVF